MHLNFRIAVWSVLILCVAFLAWPLVPGYSVEGNRISELQFFAPGVFLAVAYAVALRPLRKWWRHVLFVGLTGAVSFVAVVIGAALAPIELAKGVNGLVLGSAFGALTFALLLRFVAGLKHISFYPGLLLVLAGCGATIFGTFAWSAIELGERGVNAFFNVPWWMAVTAVVLATSPTTGTPSNQPLHPDALPRAGERRR